MSDTQKDQTQLENAWPGELKLELSCAFPLGLSARGSYRDDKSFVRSLVQSAQKTVANSAIATQLCNNCWNCCSLSGMLGPFCGFPVVIQSLSEPLNRDHSPNSQLRQPWLLLCSGLLDTV